MPRKISNTIVRLVVVAQISALAAVAAAQTKVACVGDSITALPTSWCGGLSTKLGAGYMVSNFGVSGANLMKSVGQPYWNTRQFGPSHDFNPNIVVIMLGTNDGVPRVWNGGKDHFVADYEALVDSYTSLSTMPRVYAVLPPPAGTGPFGHDGAVIENEVIPAIKMAAMNKMITTIDVFNAFGGSDFDTSLFSASEQIHPNAKGQQLICDTVYAALMSSGGLGGAGTGGTAGAAGAAVAGSGGSAGMIAAAGTGSTANAGAGGTTSANTGGTGTAGAGVSAGAAAPAAGSGNIGVSGTGASANAGSNANTSGGAGVAAGNGSANAGTSSTTRVDPLSTAGTSAPMPMADDSEGGGCRTTGNFNSEGGSAAMLVLLFGIVMHRGKKRSERARDPRRAKNSVRGQV